MRVRTLVEALRFEQGCAFEYRGDLDASFDGFDVRAGRRTIHGLFAALIDDHWPDSRRRRYGVLPADLLELVRRARSRGAAGYVMSRDMITDEIREFLEGENHFIVENSMDFVFDLARTIRHRERSSMITAITGSAGKSTTSAMTAHALASLGIGPIQLPTGNQNLYEHVTSQISQSGRFPHSVLEVAASACKQLQHREFAIEADVAVVTSIAEAHIDRLSDLRQVAEMKSAVFDGPPPGGTAVICIDTKHSDLLIERAYRAGRQVITYGESPQAAIRLVGYEQSSGTVTAMVGSEQVEYRVGVEGKHMALNSLAVIAVLRAYRVLAWRRGVESLEGFVPVDGRGEMRAFSFGDGARATIVNEAYNANPASMRATLDALREREVPSNGRRVAILGDMLELGHHSEAVHRELASGVQDADLDEIVLFGPEMAALHAELANRSMDCHYFATLEEMTTMLPEILRDRDVVLAKASGGMRLKEWIAANTRHPRESLNSEK